MKEKPILFSTPMVKAILEGRKTMTRRTRGLNRMNEHPDDWTITTDVTDKGILFFNKKGYSDRAKPQYQIGDRLWVRETFFEARKWKHAPLFSDGPDFIYRADEDAFIGDHNWKPSLFMPKEAVRI